MRSLYNFLALCSLLLSPQLQAQTGVDLQIYNYTKSMVTLHAEASDCVRNSLNLNGIALASEITALTLKEENSGSCYNAWNSQKLTFKKNGNELGSLVVKIRPGKLGAGYHLKIDDVRMIDASYRLYSYPGTKKISTWSKMTARIAIYEDSKD